MKKLIFIIIVLVALNFGLRHQDTLRQVAGLSTESLRTMSGGQSDALRVAFLEHRSGIQASGEGRVTRILPDDTVGSRHQRFILTLSSGQTLLIAHNIDLAPRINAIQRGDIIEFHGVYEWNAKGGTIHWTHRDPRNRHQAGWLRHAGRVYQ